MDTRSYYAAVVKNAAEAWFQAKRPRDLWEPTLASRRELDKPATTSWLLGGRMPNIRRAVAYGIGSPEEAAKLPPSVVSTACGVGDPDRTEIAFSKMLSFMLPSASEEAFDIGFTTVVLAVFEQLHFRTDLKDNEYIAEWSFSSARKFIREHVDEAAAFHLERLIPHAAHNLSRERPFIPQEVQIYRFWDAFEDSNG